LHVYWSYLILRIAVKQLTTGGAGEDLDDVKPSLRGARACLYVVCTAYTQLKRSVPLTQMTFVRRRIESCLLPFKQQLNVVLHVICCLAKSLDGS
jgi:hypothetical protein